MVVSTMCGESKPIYRGLFIIEGYEEEYFFSIWVAA
jgi:hypothetical protein